MKKGILFVALYSSLLLLSGCSMFNKKDGKDGGADGLNEASLDAARERRFSEGGVPTAEGEGAFRDILFDYDSSTLSDMARQDLEYNLEVLRNNSDVKIQLEGHCDERGTNEYNMVLGGNRAHAGANFLTSLGIDKNRVSTVSYGEELPLDPSHNEAAWAKNRRAHFNVDVK